MRTFDGVGQHIGWQQARDYLDTERRVTLTAAITPQRLQPTVQDIGAAFAEVAGDKKQQLLEIRVERRMTTLLDAEFGAHHHRL